MLKQGLQLLHVMMNELCVMFCSHLAQFLTPEFPGKEYLLPPNLTVDSPGVPILCVPSVKRSHLQCYDFQNHSSDF